MWPRSDTSAHLSRHLRHHGAYLQRQSPRGYGVASLPVIVEDRVPMLGRPPRRDQPMSGLNGLELARAGQLGIKNVLKKASGQDETLLAVACRRLALAHVASPIARRRPDRKNSRCSGFRRKLASGIRTEVMVCSRSMISRASASRSIWA